MKKNDFPPKGEMVPLIETPQQEYSTSEYDKKCNDLEEFIKKVHCYFMWYSSKEKDRCGELCSIVYLECLFLQMLRSIRGVLGLRSIGLYNESIDKFKGLLGLMNGQMQRGTSYIRHLNDCLRADLATDDSYTFFIRRDVADGFGELAGWVKGLTYDPQNEKRAKELIDELGLNYSKRMFGCIGDNFEQHANMVMNGLMLLAIPSHIDAGDNKFAELYKNSLEAFGKCNYCKECIEVLSSEIDDGYNAKGISTNAQKIEHLKKLWGDKKAEIRRFLSQLDVSYTNTTSNAGIGNMGRKLYEALNLDSEKPDRKMSNNQLRCYFKKEVELSYIASEIERLKTFKEDPTPGKEFFAENVKRSILHQALYKTIHEEQGLRRNGEKRYVLGAQGHWLAILKVMQTYGMVRGSMNDFALLMNKWFPVPMAPCPCDYRSMISVRAFEVKTKPYPEWSKLEQANFPYLRVAETFVKYLREYELVE